MQESRYEFGVRLTSRFAMRISPYETDLKSKFRYWDHQTDTVKAVGIDEEAEGYTNTEIKN